AMVVVARRMAELHREPGPVAPPAVVELLQHIGNPPRPGLDADPGQIREPIVHPRRDDLGQVDDEVRRPDGGEPREVVAPDTLRLRLLQLPHHADVEVDGYAGLLARVPEWIVVGTDGRTDARHGVDP